MNTEAAIQYLLKDPLLHMDMLESIRSGSAELLETFLINRLLDCGRVPFAQIVTDNTASLELQRKLGFTVSDKTLSWLMM
jgi:hypothetical protein